MLIPWSLEGIIIYTYFLQPQGPQLGHCSASLKADNMLISIQPRATSLACIACRAHFWPTWWTPELSGYVDDIDM